MTTDVEQEDMASRLLHSIACSTLSEVDQQLRTPTSGESRWSGGSVVAHLWQGVEDHILRVMSAVILPFGPKHFSLRFDGLRKDTNNVRKVAGGGGRNSSTS